MKHSEEGKFSFPCNDIKPDKQPRRFTPSWAIPSISRVETTTGLNSGHKNPFKNSETPENLMQIKIRN